MSAAAFFLVTLVQGQIFLNKKSFKCKVFTKYIVRFTLLYGPSIIYNINVNLFDTIYTDN